ncbi:hypothetical protein [Sulfitobacter aestuariivivens]|uniref:hypothetical protein n=1 Tax=Sulfitobacter aestuariivivens TaxID=2766981 RepID=UPI0036136729
MIARAQATCSPAMLARHLHLSIDEATQLFGKMVRDGVLRAPGVAGVARAVHPLPGSGIKPAATRKATTRLGDWVRTEMQPEGSPPMVNSDDAGLGCGDADQQDDTDAREDQPPEDIPQSR